MIAVLGGACTLSGHPVAPAVLRDLEQRLRVPGEGWHASARHAGSGGLVELRRAPAAAAPRREPDLVFHGYLHNGPELRQELIREGQPVTTDAGDAEVALAAYRQWGPRFVGRLMGEFALLLWDAPGRRLVAARDALGLRDLFFSHRDDLVLVASQAVPLTRRDLSLDDLDPEYLADFLASHTVVGRRSPLRGVDRLPAGSLLTVEGGRLRIEQHWEIAPERQVRFDSEEEYVQEFRRLFEDAVVRSCRIGGKIWSELSGGLDSSSIAAVAQELRAHRPGFLPGFATLSMTWPNTPDSDEREWQKAVIEHQRLENHEVACDELAFDDAAVEAMYRSEPHFAILMHPLYRDRVALLRQHGVSTVLSGSRAEVVVLPETPPPVHLADLLRSLHLRELGAELSAWQKALHEPLSNVFLRNAVGPLLNRRKMNLTSTSSFQVPAWIREDFAKRYDMKHRAKLGRMPVRFESAAMQYQYEMIGRSEPFIQRGYQPLCVEVRHPFLYRPLVEYSMAIPWQMKVRPGVFKWLLRRAMVGTLPEIVRRRATKRGPGPALYRLLPSRWPQLAPLIGDPVLAELGVVDPKRFRQAGELARVGSSKNFGLFTGTLALEIWVRTHFLRQQPLRAIA